MRGPMFTVVVPTIGRPTLERTLESIRVASDDLALAEIIIVVDRYEAATGLVEDVRRRADAVLDLRAMPLWSVVSVDAGFHDWGSPQLQHGYKLAAGAWIMNMGDDDVLEPFAFETIKRAIESLPEPVPMMFRTVLHPAPQRGNTVPVVLWHDPELRNRNITGQCFVIPNDQSRIGRWDILVDFGFITSTVELWGGRISWQTPVVSQCY